MKNLFTCPSCGGIINYDLYYRYRVENLLGHVVWASDGSFYSDSIPAKYRSRLGSVIRHRNEVTKCMCKKILSVRST